MEVYLPYIIGALIVIAIAIFVASFFIKKREVKQWLLIAVYEAEEALGAGAGQEKLKLVHGWMLEAFPIFGKILPFPLFSAMVDAALKIMENNLNTDEEEE